MAKYNSRLIIRNFGSIKNIDIEINKVNIIIGKQSSGKSTIVKILSFCQWIEKRYIIEGKNNYTIEDRLQNFHRIGDEYFTPESYIEYKSEAITISFDARKNIKTEIKNPYKYYKSKNIYIPAERNFATTIPNLGRYNETNDNIMNLLYDWNEAKKQYTKTKKILALGLSFSYNEKEDEDYIHFISKGNKRKMPLRLSSSGLQSVTPLIILFDYLTDIFYKKEMNLSPFERESIEKEQDKLLNLIQTNIQQLNELKDKIKIELQETIIFENKQDLNYKIRYENMLEQLYQLEEKAKKAVPTNPIQITQYHFSRFIIEEPEQNLYPETQKELIYYFFNTLKNTNHQLTITTHSPFILYSINNCMMGYQIKDQMPKGEQKSLNSYGSWINPDLISVWQLENGELISIKDETTKVIGTHSFNHIMNSVMNEYFEMLGYFGDEE